jgi:hypothetical protein
MPTWHGNRDLLWAVCSGDWILVWALDFLHQSRIWGPPNLLYSGYIVSFDDVRQPGQSFMPCCMVLLWEWGSMVSIATISTHWWSGDWILVGNQDFSLLQSVQTDSVAHPAFYLRSTGVLYQTYRGQGLKFTSEFHLVLRLGWSYIPPSRICLHDDRIVTGYWLDGLGVELHCGQ